MNKAILCAFIVGILMSPVLQILNFSKLGSILFMVIIGAGIGMTFARHERKTRKM